MRAMLRLGRFHPETEFRRFHQINRFFFYRKCTSIIFAAGAEPFRLVREGPAGNKPARK